MSDQEIIDGLMRVAAGNDYSKRVIIHKPSLGPYTAENPNRCENCGRLLVGVHISAPCGDVGVKETT